MRVKSMFLVIMMLLFSCVLSGRAWALELKPIETGVKLPVVKIAPAISAADVAYGEEVIVKTGNSTYANAVTEVEVNGQKKIKEEFSGFGVSGADIIIYNTISGPIKVVLKAPGYFDTSCSLNVGYGAAPNIEAPDIILGQNAEVEIMDKPPIYILLVDGLTVNNKSIGDYTMDKTKGTIIIPAKYFTSVGKYTVKTEAANFSDGICELEVKGRDGENKLNTNGVDLELKGPQKQPQVFAPDVKLGNRIVIIAETPDYAYTVNSVIVSGANVMTFSKANKEITCNWNIITINQPPAVEGTFMLTLKSQQYPDAKCTVNIKSNIKDATPPAIMPMSGKAGDYLFLRTNDQAYAQVITEVVYDGRILLPGGNGFTVSQGDIRIEKSIIDKTGSYPITVKAINYSDAKCTAKIVDAAANDQIKEEQDALNHPASKVVAVFKLNSMVCAINGETLTMDAPPTLINGVTYMPIRYIAEALGAEVSWNGIEQKSSIILGAKTIELWMGKNTAMVNGVETIIDPNNPDIKPLIVNGRILMPLRFIAEKLGCGVEWIEATQEIRITYEP